jgi:hypothetical protein
MDINQHRATPHISIDAYTKQRQVELGESLDGRFPVYLDQNYWIVLRKAEAGIGSKAEVELLRLLRELTRAGSVFCPISESVLMELFKQEDLQSRLRTARLIDDLSAGISLIPYDMRAGTEIAHLIHTHNSDPSTLHPLRHLVWSKASYAVGASHPVLDGLDAATQLAIQKSFFDELWSMSLADVMKTIGDAPLPSPDAFSKLASTLNEGNAEHAGEIRSFAQAYIAESCGAASVFGAIAMDIAQSIAIKQNMPFPPKDSNAWRTQQRMWENLLFQVLQKETERTKLPSMHIPACLHAAFRWDKSRQFEANDFYDFQHASAALAFCQAFFTERSLRAVITANNVGLDQLYSCCVVSDISSAIEFLKNLGPTEASQVSEAL